MDELIYLELLDHQGGVASRHAVRSLPLRIGRAYDNDLILEDPYVAPHHVALEQAPGGELEIVDAGSRNGLFRAGERQRLVRERVDPSARYRAGRTEFRVRSSAYPVAEEIPEPSVRGVRDALLAGLAVLAVVAALVFDGWSTTDVQTELPKLARTPLLVVLALFVWAGGWTLAGRLLSGTRRFAAHLSAAAIAVIGILVAEQSDYLAYALSAPLADYLGLFLVGAALTWGLSRHLGLVAQRSRRSAVLAGSAIATGFVGTYLLLAYLGGADDPMHMAYLKHIKPPELRVAHGTEVARFFQDAQSIKGELEALRRK